MPMFWVERDWLVFSTRNIKHLSHTTSHKTTQAFTPTSSSVPSVRKVFYAGGLPLSCIPVPERWNN